MDCERVRTLLQEALDQGGDPPPGIGKHLSACAWCRQTAESLRRTDAMLTEIPELEWTSDLTAGVMRGVRRARTRDRWVAVAAAAMLLLAAWLGFEAISADPSVAEAVRTVSGAVPSPGSPEAILSTVYEGAAGLAEEADSALGRSPLAASLPVAAVGALLALLLMLNGFVIGRPLVARRRRS